MAKLDFLLDQQVFDARLLMANHPPRWRHPNKRVVAEMSCPAISHHAGQVVYSRWKEMPLPDLPAKDDTAMVLDVHEGLFVYSADMGSLVVHWHVNFADEELFVAYGSGLLAQDELQVLEHPVLGALREALGADQRSTLTVERGRPTPILVQGAERRCALATTPDATQGRPGGLYGNAFSRARPETVQRAVQVIDPPTVSNILAMAAPSYGSGLYQEEEIRLILATAYTGFSAARQASLSAEPGRAAVVIHTGFWGCGAFGGNRVLMAILQILAARMAGVSRLAFYTFDRQGAATLAEAQRVIDQRIAPDSAAVPVTELIQRIQGLSFRWGTSDGN